MTTTVGPAGVGTAGVGDTTTQAGRTRRPPPAPPRRRGLYLGLLGLVLALNAFGLVMVLSASSVSAVAAGDSAFSYFNRQLVWVALALLVLFVTVGVDYAVWRKLAGPGLMFTFVMLAAILVPGVGHTAGGATRWVAIGPLTFQPSELAKLTLLLYVADLLERRSHVIADRRRSLHPVLLVSVPVVGLVFVQPDLGTSIILAAVVIAALLVAGVPMKPLLGTGLIGAALALAAGLGAGYRQARITAFLDPWADPLSAGYQTLQSLVGLASGGTDGVGLGAGRSKWGFLPNAHTDFIFAIVGEELGLIGSVLLVVAFVALGVLGLRAAARAPDVFGTIVAAGITVWLMFQAFVNVGGVTGMLPITGVTLPFVSFGGTSLLVNAAAAGVLCNIARQAR